MIYYEFEVRVGPVTPLEDTNRRLAQCLMYNGKDKPPIPLLRGTFWTIGYFREGIQPRTANLDWEAFAGYVQKARTYADMLEDVCLQTSISSPFFPFLLPLSEGKEAVKVFEIYSCYQTSWAHQTLYEFCYVNEAFRTNRKHPPAQQELSTMRSAVPPQYAQKSFFSTYGQAILGL